MSKKPDYSTLQNPALDPVVMSMIGSNAPAQPGTQPISDQRNDQQTAAAVESILAQAATLRNATPTRSRRVQLVLRPDIHDKLKRRAASEGVSVNDFVHTLLEVVLTDEKALEAITRQDE